MMLYVMYARPPFSSHQILCAHSDHRLCRRSRIYATGGTTSPSSTFKVNPHQLEGLFEFVQDSWDSMTYPSFPCPAHVLLVILEINQLRAEPPSRGRRTPGPGPETLLRQLQAFSPESWAASKPTAQEAWRTVADAHRSAAILYCLSALGQHFDPSSHQTLEVQRALHSSRLFALLRETDESTALRWSVVWPFVVAAVEAAREGAAARRYVRARFGEMADDRVTPLGFEAMRVLDAFWTSGRVRWDECFDKPYAFVM